MKLTNEDISNLSSILSTCAIGGIESIIVEDGNLRGIDEARTFVIISQHNIPKFPQKIGLSRLGSLKQRMELFVGNSATVMQANESERGEISSLDIAAGRNKVQFRCTSTMLIKAPKAVNDTETHRLTFSKEELKLVLNAAKVMGSKTIQLVIKKDGTVSIIVNDAANDAFSMVLDAPAQNIGDDGDSVVHYYHAAAFMSVMREHAASNDVAGAVIGEAGTFRTALNGHTVYLLPKVNEDSED